MPPPRSPRSQGGSSTVEFALVLPLLFVVSLALIQMALLGRDQLLVEAAARAGARAAAVVDDQTAVVGAALRAAPTLDPVALVKIDPAAPRIVPRLIAQIANEAAFAREEEIGSPEDMDTAMRLGFNWPLGPIEFTELIGARRAVELLEELRATGGEAYRPAPALLEAAGPG